MRPRSKKLGDKNVIGSRVVQIRKSQGLKHGDFLTKLQLIGLNISSTALTRLEGQDRHAKDYEVFAVAKVLNVDICELYKTRENGCDRTNSETL